MGEVHLARQVALNRLVALKFLTRTTGDPPDQYEARFRQEAELMARISHPNVVTIFDFGTVAGRPYLVMEYVEGGDLRSRMVPDLPMGIGEIRAIMKPVVKAVEYLHSQGIVHRDMKPENILMHHEETPKVTDFGIAVLDFAVGSLTRTGQALGTPGYVAPEQQYGLKVDARADQFSLAALCYELATGRKPLGAFPPPHKLNPKLGPEAGEVILKALSNDPTDRFATIGEFGQALDRGLATAGPRKLSKGRKALVASIAALSILVGLAILLVPRPAPDRGVPASGPMPTTRGPQGPARLAAR
jgi:serine/threonine protein kinase